jgi:hypothetical protein
MTIRDKLYGEQPVPKPAQSQAEEPAKKLFAKSNTASEDWALLKRRPKAMLGLATPVIWLVAGLILQSLTASDSAACNSMIGAIGQAFSTKAVTDCGLVNAGNTIGTVLAWFGGIGTILVATIMAVFIAKLVKERTAE